MRRYSIGLLSVFVLLLAPLTTHAATAADRAALQGQLDELNKEIDQNQQQLAAQQKQRTSLERDVSILDSKIQQAQLQIKQRNLTITSIKGDIADKQTGIDSLDSQVAKGQESLAQILRRTREIDDLSFVQIALQGSFSELFNDISNFETVQKALGDSFTTMAVQRSDLAARKSALQDKQQEEKDLLQIQVLQQTSLKDTEKQKQDLVTAARGQESIYQQIIANKQKSAAQIKAALFSLNNANTSTSFGQMYGYAKEASAATNVRPALILAILREESNLGQNVGTGNWRNDMNPTRDAPVFQQICAALGLSPDSMPVSKKPWYGWGGAMGPAQFIPSTWQLYQDRIAQASGQTPPNPWDPRTAAFAAAILMMDNGADARTPAAERLAALRYLAGWKNASKSAYAFYGNDVMGYADEYQQDINVLTGS